LNYLYMRFNRTTIFEQFARKLDAEPVKAKKSEPMPIESTYRPQRQRRARASSSFVTNW
jgi:hypothetical protein